jgi:hypothetical protein
MTMPMSRSVVTNSIDRAAFRNFYAGPAPWDIGKPQPAFTAVADQVTGPIFDAGCGTGEHALFFAARGQTVVGSTSWTRRSSGRGPRRPSGVWR